MGRSLILEIPFSGQQVPFRQNSSALGHLGRRKIACAACSTAVSIHCQGNNPLKAGTHQPWATVGTVEWHALLAAPRSQSSKESKITSHHVTGIPHRSNSAAICNWRHIVCSSASWLQSQHVSSRLTSKPAV